MVLKCVNGGQTWCYEWGAPPGFYTFDITDLTQGYDSGLENNGWIFEQSYQTSLDIFYSP